VTSRCHQLQKVIAAKIEGGVTEEGLLGILGELETP